MLNLIQTMSQSQKKAVLLALHTVLVPLALVASLIVFDISALDSTTLTLISLMTPALMMLSAAFAYVMGLSHVPLAETETTDVAPTALVAVGLASASAAMSSVVAVSAPSGVHVVFGLTYFLLSLLARLALLRMVTYVYQHSADRVRVLIYGAGSTGAQLAIALRGHKTIEPVAFIDDNVTLQGLRVSRLPVYSPLKIAEIVAERQIDRVLLAAPSMGQPKQAQLLRKLEAMGLEVQALPSFAQLIGEAPLLDKLTPASKRLYLGREEIDGVWQTERTCYAGRVIMVTGAGGSIGAELCRQLLDLHPAKIVLLELSEFALYTVDLEIRALAEGRPIEIVTVLGSVTESRQVRKVMQDHCVQVVIHAAAYKHVPLVEDNPMAGLVNNVLGTQTVVQQSLLAGIERFILISSDKAVRPANVMGASKRLAEGVVQNAARQVARESGPIFSIVRFGNVLGSSGSVVPLFQEQINRGGPVTVTDPNVMRYFMTVQEAVKLVLESGSMAQGDDVFVLDMGAPVSILHLARQVIEKAGYTVKDETTPMGDIEIVMTGLRRGEKLVEELTLSDDLRATEHAKIFCAQEDSISEQDITLALRRLREAFVASDDALARKTAMAFVEAEDVVHEGRAASGIRA